MIYGIKITPIITTIEAPLEGFNIKYNTDYNDFCTITALLNILYPFRQKSFVVLLAYLFFFK